MPNKPSITVDGVEIELTPEQVAELLWHMSDYGQARMFAELIRLSEGEHLLMMQFIWARQECEKQQERGEGKPLDAFQTMFSAGYKYMGQ